MLLLVNMVTSRSPAAVWICGVGGEQTESSKQLKHFHFALSVCSNVVEGLFSIDFS
jgi:hypothetical protein